MLLETRVGRRHLAQGLLLLPASCWPLASSHLRSQLASRRRRLRLLCTHKWIYILKTNHVINAMLYKVSQLLLLQKICTLATFTLIVPPPPAPPSAPCPRSASDVSDERARECLPAPGLVSSPLGRGTCNITWRERDREYQLFVNIYARLSICRQHFITTFAKSIIKV